MQRVLRRTAWFAAASMAAVPGSARPASAQAQLPIQLELRVPKAPTLVRTATGSALSYELHVTNLLPVPVTLKAVDVVSADPARRTLHTLSDTLLAQSVTRPGMTLAAAERVRIGPGLRGVVLMWVPAERAAVPAAVRNRVRVEIGTGDSARTQSLDGVPVPVTKQAVRIAPPLRGGPWLIGNGPAPLTGHRRALIAIEGTPVIAQRFAIDYVQLNDSNATFRGDRLKNASYLAQSQEALAVADGRVVATRDSIPENVPGVMSRAVPITLETVGGNYVIIDIGGGHYAFYAHLQPGSLRVRVGDRVKTGQVVGLVGNSGNSTEPHLHFHIADGISPLGSEGVPYEYETFEIVGRCRTFTMGCERIAPDTRRRELPLGNTIVNFPTTRRP